MRKTKRRMLAITSALAFCVACLVGISVAIAAGGGRDLSPTRTAEPLLAEYPIGATVEIPPLEIDGKKATATVLTPSQKYYICDSLTLDEEGQYTVVYKYADGSAVRSREQTFLAYSKLYETQAAVSSATFGQYAYGDYTIEREAVLASIAAKDRLTFKPIVDLNALNGDTFLEFFVTPEAIGTEDVQKIMVVLTDIYDPDNFVTIAVKKAEAGDGVAAWAELNSYITGNAVGQVPSGLESGAGRTGITIDGNEYALRKGDVFGANIVFALPANPKYSVTDPAADPQYVGSQTLRLKMYEDGKIYANDKLVTALKNTDIYERDPWSGFTTGEVALSVYGEGYNASALNLAITKMGDCAAEGLRVNRFTDNVAPDIRIEWNGADGDNLPEAVVGRPYRVWNASAYDRYSKDVAVKTQVYYAYNTADEYRVDVADGAFTPQTEGAYTLVYKSKDVYGNLATQTFEIHAAADSAPILTATVDTLAAADSGRAYDVPVPTFCDARGAVRWSAVATLRRNPEVRYEIDGENPVFTPEYAGEYDFVYRFSDHIVAGTLEKTLTVNVSDRPVIFGDAVLPKYIVAGCKYALPRLTGKRYSQNDWVACEPEILVVEDGGAARKCNGNLVTYAERNVQIIYRIDVDGEKAERVFDPIPVIDVGYNGNYKIDSYFYGEGFETDAQPTKIRFTAKYAEGTAAAKQFINPLYVYDFQLRLAAGGNGFGRINILLEDSADSSVQVLFSYILQNNKVYFSINDATPTLLSGAEFGNLNAPLSFSYDNVARIAMPTGVASEYRNIAQDLNGKRFDGFKSMFAYMTLEVADITNKNNAAIDILSINGQRTTSIPIDQTKPKISAVAASGDRPCGTEYTVGRVYAGDVLDPAVTCKMRITAPDGRYVVSNDGVVLQNVAPDRDYTITLSQFGRYVVGYTATDIYGNELVYEYVLSSADVTPPTVEIVAPTVYGNVGKAVPVAEIRIADNKDGEIGDFTVYVSVTAPDMQTYTLGKNDDRLKSFVLKAQGEYTVTYTVFDSSGNMTQQSYRVTAV